MSSENPKITVGIPTVRAEHIGSAIHSIQAQSFQDWELLIMGQGDEPTLRNTVLSAAGSDPRVHYLHQAKAGTCAARNAVFRSARAEIIALIDDDCEAAPDWLQTIDNLFGSHADVLVLGGEVRPPKLRSRTLFSYCAKALPVETCYDPKETPNRPPKGFVWIGCNLAIRKSVVETVGYFDEFLGPGSPFPAGEDIDYLLRLESAGVKMMTTPRSLVHHTYGRRYGLLSVMKNQRNYARGNGALAAKLVLANDPRGVDMVIRNKLLITRRLTFKRNPINLPFVLRRAWFFLQGYKECRADYSYNSVTHVLSRER